MLLTIHHKDDYVFLTDCNQRYAGVRLHREHEMQ